METINCETPEELFAEAHRLVAEELEKRLEERETATLTLAGGSTPKALHALLARNESLPWRRIHLFWGDERLVPPDSPDSNYRMARETLVSHIPIPEGNVHRVRTELGAEEAAKDYESTIEGLCGGHTPMLDVVVLGIGPDGHTASLFPGQPQLEATSLVAATPTASRKPQVRRITMTYRLLNSAALVLFLVSGEEKQPVLKHLLAGGAEAAAYPASRVSPSGRLVYLVHPPQPAG